jgi:probable HAF family extracellular repeat protein
MILIEFDSGAQRNLMVIAAAEAGLLVNAGQLINFSPMRKPRGESMKFKKWSFIVEVTLVAMLAFPLGAAAQDNLTRSQKGKHHHYKLVVVGTFGGPNSNFNHNGAIDINDIAVLNRRGSITGNADTSTPDPFAGLYTWSWGYVAHTFQWQNGAMTDMGALPGGGSSSPTWQSTDGFLVGVSENGLLDPLFSNLPQVHAVLWKNGSVTDLGTLPGGGYQSEAEAVNSRGQVVGSALNTIPDPNSMASSNFWYWYVPYGYQQRAFLWDEKSGMQDLGTLGTGTDARATLINQKGQVVGWSYTNSAPGACGNGFALNTASFIWDQQNGMTDLGNLGGTCTLAFNLSNAGLVVGISNLPGDSYQHAFLWENGTLNDLGGTLGGDNTGANALNEHGEAVGSASLIGNATSHAALWKHVGQITDLGTLGKDACSFADAINNSTQIVGDSTSAKDCVHFDHAHPFLWERGSIVNLNALIPRGGLHLVYAYAINDRGEIAANGLDANVDQHAALLIPCDQHHLGVEGCDYSLVDATGVLQSPALRSLSRAPQRPAKSRRTNRYHIPGLQPPRR